MDPVVLLSIGGALAVLAVYLLFLRNAVMLGFVCIVGIVVLGILYLYPDWFDRTF